MHLSWIDVEAAVAERQRLAREAERMAHLRGETKPMRRGMVEAIRVLARRALPAAAGTEMERRPARA